MIRRLHTHGFKTLVDTTISFEPLTIMLGKNGAGKTAILDSLQLIGNFARGGVHRALGPPPWSLDWLRTRGRRSVSDVVFKVSVELGNGREYSYSLCLEERRGEPAVRQEKLVRQTDGRVLASSSPASPPPSGTILKPQSGDSGEGEIRKISGVLKSTTHYELNPEAMEQGVDREHTYLGRDGFGAAGFLAHLLDEAPDRFAQLQACLKRIRPETQAIEVWSSAEKLYWGLRDIGQDRVFPAIHLSWGDRQLVGILCALHAAKPGTAMAIEEIDRGLHHSRYFEVLELLTRAAYDGLDGRRPVQIITTTHSPSFVNHLQDRIGEVRSVMCSAEDGTLVRPLSEVLLERLGTAEPKLPVGEIWETGLLDELPPAAH